jgi:hypothetical protein
MASRTTKCRPVAYLGVVSYYDSLRVNLGLFQPDLNVLRDLGPHDFSIMDYLAERNGVTLMVDHTYLFHGVVRKLRELHRNDSFAAIEPIRPLPQVARKVLGADPVMGAASQALMLLNSV